MSPRTRNLLLTIGIPVVIVGIVFVWWTSGDAPDEVDIANALSEAPTATSEGATPTASDGTQPTATPGATDAAPSSSWTVDTDSVAYEFAESTGTFVGFRIDEELVEQGAVVAVGRTPTVTGSLTVDGMTITDAEFSADLRDITSDVSRRETAIQRTLDTDTHQFATFELDEPIELGTVPPLGEAIEAEGTGTLTINGTSQTVTIPLAAALVADDQLLVTSSFEVALTDYGMEPPSASVVVSVADVATVEIQLYFAPA